MIYMLLRMRDLDMKSREIDLKLQRRAPRSGIHFSARNIAFSSNRLQKTAALALNRRRIRQLLSIDLFEKTQSLSSYSRIYGNFGDADQCTQLKLLNLCWDSTDFRIGKRQRQMQIQEPHAQIRRTGHPQMQIPHP